MGKVDPRFKAALEKANYYYHKAKATDTKFPIRHLTKLESALKSGMVLRGGDTLSTLNDLFKIHYSFALRFNDKGIEMYDPINDAVRDMLVYGQTMFKVSPTTLYHQPVIIDKEHGFTYGGKE